MRALYGEGLHPNADRIMGYAAGSGLPPRQALSASRLGRKFLVRDGEPEFARRLAVAYRDHNAEAGEHWNATITADVRARIRSRVAVNLFSEAYGRPRPTIGSSQGSSRATPGPAPPPSPVMT